MNNPPVGWQEANQPHLNAALALLRANIQNYVAQQSSSPPAPPLPAEFESFQQALHGASAAMPAPAALEELRATFGLSPFESDVLLLCAAMEFDAAFAPLCAAAQADPRRNFPTFGLALSIFANAHWSALSPSAPLRHWHLIEVSAGDLLTSSALRIDERILHFLVGLRSPDERLRGIADPLPAPRALPDSQRALAEQVASAWSNGEFQPALPIVQLCGSEISGKRAVAAAACSLLGLDLRVMQASVISRNAPDRDFLIRLCERESALHPAALLLEFDDEASDPLADAAANRFIETLRSPLVVSTRTRRHSSARLFLSFDLPALAQAEQRALWEEALGEAGAKLNGNVESLVSQFHLSATEIFSVAARALRSAAPRVGEQPPNDAESRRDPDDSSNDLAEALWNACRAESRPRLENLAQRIEPAADWDDLVLPDQQRRVLREIAIHVKQRSKVYDQWDFISKGTRGLGISALFAGASGTGKTMAAEVLANDLRLDLYRIDLSQVVSKYIGETEKNLRRVFDAADEGSAVLLFDEADALFGKRSEVKDSHDRYANIEISYLLQRMESYRGLAILATNMKSALDHSFLRRIRFVVDFPFPDSEQRAEIWRRIFPASLPMEGLRIDRLARLNVAGGHIRNIAMNAAFLAADSGEPLRMKHLLHAVRGEYAKLEKSLTELETVGWV